MRGGGVANIINLHLCTITPASSSNSSNFPSIPSCDCTVEGPKRHRFRAHLRIILPDVACKVKFHTKCNRLNREFECNRHLGCRQWLDFVDYVSSIKPLFARVLNPNHVDWRTTIAWIWHPKPYWSRFNAAWVQGALKEYTFRQKHQKGECF